MSYAESRASRPPTGVDDLATRAGPFPERPPLSTPEALQDTATKRVQERQVAAQPLVGLVGIVFAVAAFAILAFANGGIESSLLVFGPITSFGLAPIAMIAFYWNDWPGTRLRAPFSGFADTLIVIVLAIALTIAAQAIVARFDVTSVFIAQPGPHRPATFPATLPLAGAAFAATLQITLVCEGWPMRKLGRIWSGLATLVISWAVAVGLFFLTNIDDAPPAVHASGVRNPGGPFSGADFGGMLIALGVWQSLFYVGLRGWPFAGLTSRTLRLLLGNAVTIGLGFATFIGLHNGAGWSTGTVQALCGCAVSAILLVGMLFEGWPGTIFSKLPGRSLDVLIMAGLTAGLYLGLTAFADGIDFIRAEPTQWVTTAGLTFLGAGIILHVAIGKRWPLTIPETDSHHASAEDYAGAG